jgi:hypothetical protein
MNNINAFVDSVGRVIVGEVLDNTSDSLKVKEPAVVNVQVNQESGQISVQLLPFIFREFVKTDIRDKGVEWVFPKNTIVTSENLELEDSIKQQYKNIFNQPVATPEGQKTEEPEVVKLFDDDDD